MEESVLVHDGSRATFGGMCQSQTASERTPFPVIETERLLLREIVAQDTPALFAIHGDPEIMRWFGKDPLPNVSAAEDLINAFAYARLQANADLRWAIQLKGQPALIGTFGFFNRNRDWHKCTLGYELAVPARKRGYMREALSAGLSWAFRNMDLHRVEALIHPENVSSLNTVRKLGFIQEGLLRQVGYWGKRFHDMLQFSLLQQEWESTRPERGAAHFERITTWKYVGHGIKGDQREVSGIRVWSHEWKCRRGEQAEVTEPFYGQRLSFPVYEITTGERQITFAAGEFANGIYGFYTSAT